MIKGNKIRVVNGVGKIKPPSVSGGNPASESISVEYLVVGGGGGGGGFGNNPQFGGGGGGGGVLSGSQSLSSGQTYTVTVGGGGLGGGTGVARGTNGANSVFSSLTALGGGGGGIGGGALASGLSGGCGGGGGSNYAGAPTRFIGSAGAGTIGQGNNGGRGHHDNEYETVAAGGGGGAGAAGADGTRFGSGKGGDGALSSITGTATRYAGGGAGMGDISNGGAGLGGGGNLNTAGETNTGGGGGAADYYGLGATGGSGVVIIAYQGAALSSIDPGLTYTLDTTSRAGWRIYRFTAGTGPIVMPSASATLTPAFSAQSVVLTSNSSYTVPTGATSMKVWVIGGGGAWSNYCDGGADRAGGNGAVAVRTYSVSGGAVSYSIGAGDTYNCNNAKFAGATTVTYLGVSIIATGGRSQNNEWVSFPYSGEANNGCTNATTCGTAGSNVDGLNEAVTLAGGSISGRGIGGVAFGASGGAGAVVLYFT